MSSWTYIVGNISVRMWEITDETAEYILKTTLRHLPKVHGSEGNMEVKIVNTGYVTGWSSHDEFQMWTNRKGYDEHQEFNVVINAHLRDAYFDETYREFVKWLTRLAKRVPVTDGCIKISDGWYGRVEMIDCEKFDRMYESGDDNWCDYMRWNYYDGYCLPKELIAKYYPELLEGGEVDG